MSKFDPYDHLQISLNPDGSLTRHSHSPTAAATGESPQSARHAALSKDVTLNADKKTWMRIYLPAKLPSNDQTVARLPILVFFHGGGWVRSSVAEPILHAHSSRISAELPSILIAVEFRLAPEHRLPAQYDDAADAVDWVRIQPDLAGGDQWIRDFADLSRCYLYGASCGANIAFHAALRAGEMDLDLRPLKIAGVILSQPFFGGERRTGSEEEMRNDEHFPVPVQDLLWQLALPVGSDRDHRFSNPVGDAAVMEKVGRIGRCLVIGFGGDPLIDRQRDFVRVLERQGVTVEVRFEEAGFHGIDMVDSKAATTVLNFIKEFV